MCGDSLDVGVGLIGRPGPSLGPQLQLAYEPEMLTWPLGSSVTLSLAPEIMAAKDWDPTTWQNLLLGVGARTTVYIGDRHSVGFRWLPWMSLPVGYATQNTGDQWDHYARVELQIAPFQYSWENVVTVAPVLGGGGLLGESSIPYGFAGVAFQIPLPSPAPSPATAGSARGATDVEEPEPLPPVPIRELIPGHNRMTSTRANLVFVKVNFSEGPAVSDDDYETLAHQIVDAGGNGTELEDRTYYGIFGAVPDDNPFHGEIDRFNFWVIETTYEVGRHDGELCSGVGLPIETYNQLARAVRQQNHLGDIFFMTLMADPEQCRPQGTWIDITRSQNLSPLLVDSLDPEAFFSELPQSDLSDIGQAFERGFRVDHFLRELFPRLEAPVAWVSILDGNGAIDRSEITVARHEVGHLFHLWDEYEEAGVSDNPELERILQQLDQEYLIVDLIDRLVQRYPPAAPLWKGLRGAVPPITIRPLDLIAANPVTEEIFGGPLGYPNCAPSDAVAQRWWQEVPGQEGIVPTRGCLYDDQHFVRSIPSSVMRNSHSPTAPFGPVNAHFIRQRLLQYRP